MSGKEITCTDHFYRSIVSINTKKKKDQLLANLFVSLVLELTEVVS